MASNKNGNRRTRSPRHTTMKKGTIVVSVAISVALLVAILVIFAIFQAQTKTKTGSWIDKMKETIMPNKMETVVVPGTKVGEGCPTVPVGNANDVVQALIDCYKQGDAIGGDIACCYKLNFAGTQTITAGEIQEKLKQRSAHLADGRVIFEDQFHLPGSTPTICFQDSMTMHRVRITYIPAKCTASSGLWVGS